MGVETTVSTRPRGRLPGVGVDCAAGCNTPITGCPLRVFIGVVGGLSGQIIRTLCV